MLFLHRTQISRRFASARLWLVVASLLMWVQCGETASAKDRIWSALLLATNSDTPKKPLPEVARYSHAVQRVFGYNQIELIGSATQTIDEQCERWLVPTQNFWFGLKAKKNDSNNNYLLDVTLFHDKRQLVQAQAKVGPSSPLFIRGPMHARGQLLIVLQVLP